jgi:hypothetical protein
MKTLMCDQRKKGWGKLGVALCCSGVLTSTGVRARKYIPEGRFVGLYAGELITEEESERRGAIYEHIGRTWVEAITMLYQVKKAMLRQF